MIYFYVDTNVILDVVFNRRPSSKELFEYIKEKKFKCCTSRFALMESLDVIQENYFILKEIKRGEKLEFLLRRRNQRNLIENELTDTYNTLFDNFSNVYKRNVDFLDLNPGGWEYAITELMGKRNITAEDAIHAATAIQAKCDFFVSSDSDLRRVIKKLIGSQDPENMLKILKEKSG
jgi:predicted nucleic acid-binding protein